MLVGAGLACIVHGAVPRPLHQDCKPHRRRDHAAVSGARFTIATCWRRARARSTLVGLVALTIPAWAMLLMAPGYPLPALTAAVRARDPRGLSVDQPPARADRLTPRASRGPSRSPSSPRRSAPPTGSSSGFTPCSQQHALVAVDAHAAAVHCRHREAEQLEIFLGDAVRADEVHPKRAGIVPYSGFEARWTKR